MRSSKFLSLDNIDGGISKLSSCITVSKTLFLRLFLFFALIHTSYSQEEFNLEEELVFEISFEELSKIEDRLDSKNLKTQLQKVLEFHIQKAKYEGDSLELISVYNWRIWNEDYKHAKSYSDSAMMISKALKNEKAIAQTYYSIGAYSYLKNRPIEGLKMFIKAYQFSESVKFIDGSIESLNGIAAINREYGQAYKALEIQLHCLRELEANKPFVEEYIETLAYTLDATSKCFLATNQPDSAIQYANNGLKLADMLDDRSLRISFEAVIGQGLYSNGLLKESKQILESLLNDAEGESLADIYYYLGKIYSINGDSDHAIKHFSNFDSIVSSIGYPRVDHAEEVYQILLNSSISIENSTKRQTYLKNLIYYDSLMELTNAEVEKLSSIKFKLIKDESNNEKKTIYIISLVSLLILGLTTAVITVNPFTNKVDPKKVLKPSSSLPSEIVEEVLSQLKKWEQDQGFLEANITQVELASILGTNSSYLSKVINEQLGVSYTAYIKNLRTEFIIKDFDNHYMILIKKSMIQLAERYGFRSQDSFVRAFKDKTGKTPSIYLKEKRMKNKHFKVLLLPIILSPYFAFSQTEVQDRMYNTLTGNYWESNRAGNTIRLVSAKNNAEFYLDSVKIVRENYYINPESIVSIDVRNESPNKVYLIMPEGTRFVNLHKYVGQLHSLPSERNKIYFINDRPIDNPREFFIQEDQIKEVETDLKATIEGTQIDVKVIRVVTESKKSF